MKKIIEEYWPFAVVLALLAAMLLFSSCRSAKDVPILHDTIILKNDVYKDIYHHDSIYVHDSMWIEVKGDTIWIDRWHTKYVELTKYDSIAVHDTSYIKEEIPVEIEKIKYKTPSIIWWIVGILFVVSAISIVYFVRKFENYIK